MKSRVLLQILCITASAAFVSWALVMDRAGLAQPTPEGKKQQAQVGTLEDAKLKGFEGVDFSYDVFGAPPGQDPAKIAEEVMKKGAEHARTAHGMQSVPPDVAKKVQAAIKDK